MNELEERNRARTRARSFAIWAHGDQSYGESGLPYVYHLDSVAAVAISLRAPEPVIVAAYLHDVVEDTKVPISTIEDLFGTPVAVLVAAVTNEAGANRTERHARTYPKIRRAGPDATLLKLCDRVANISACAIPGPARLLDMYLKEHRAFNTALFAPGENRDAWALLDATFERLTGSPPRSLAGGPL